MKTKLVLLLMVISFIGISAQKVEKNASQEKGKFIELKTMPKIVQQAMPVYPEEAKKLGIMGKVIVEVNLDEEGNVVSTSVVTANLEGSEKSSTIDEATRTRLRDVFNQPAIDAAKKTKFSPGIDKNGKAVKCTIMQPFNFRLNSKKK